jgi:hypothetical protein
MKFALRSNQGQEPIIYSGSTGPSFGEDLVVKPTDDRSQLEVNTRRFGGWYDHSDVAHLPNFLANPPTGVEVEEIEVFEITD